MVTRVLLQYCGLAFSEKFIMPDFLFTSKSLHEISIEIYDKDKRFLEGFLMFVFYMSQFFVHRPNIWSCVHAVVLSMNVSFIANNAFTVFIDWRRVFYLKFVGSIRGQLNFTF